MGKWRLFCQYGGWALADTALNKQAWLESFLPWQDFAASLRQLGRAFLPSEDWLPACLLPGLNYCQSAEIRCAFPSLLEFWQELPDSLTGRVVFCQHELLALFCALADQQRCGTGLERYPRQQDAFRELLQATPKDSQVRILDVGCGVGFGTLELLKIAQDSGVEEAQACGLTSEPLEVWMAKKRLLPHSPQREKIWREEFPGCLAEFQLGRAENFSLPKKYSAIFCNGLLGGRFFFAPDLLRGFLSSCQQHLSPHGVVLIANSFHPGYRSKVELLPAFASQTGWAVTGDWRHLCLKRTAS